MDNTAQANRVTIWPELVPNEIRRDIGLAAYKGALKFKQACMNDPDLKRLAQDEYDAYLRRKADRERLKNGSGVEDHRNR